MKKKGAIYSDLKSALASGDQAQVDAAKKVRLNALKAQWRKKKRSEGKEFTIYLSGVSLRLIEQNARKHKRSCTAFLRESSLAYCRKEFLTIDIMAVNQIKEALVMTYCLIKAKYEENESQHPNGGRMIEIVEELERRVLACLEQPAEISTGTAVDT